MLVGVVGPKAQAMAPKRKRDAATVTQAPKRPRSGYNLFLSDNREKIFAELKKEGVANAQLMTSYAKRAGQLWKKLSGAEKKLFNDRFEESKASHEEEIEKNRNKGREAGSSSGDEGSPDETRA